MSKKKEYSTFEVEIQKFTIYTDNNITSGFNGEDYGGDGDWDF